MAEPIWIGRPGANHVQRSGATLERVGSTTTPDDLDVSNLLGPRGKPPWQTPAGTLTPTLRLDAGVAVTFRAVALALTNLRAAATWQITMSNSAAGGSEAYDSGSVSCNVALGIGLALHLMPSDVAARYVDIAISDSGNTQNYIRAGLLFAGSVFAPSAGNWQFGGSMRTAQAIARTTTAGGQSSRQVNARPKTEQFTVRRLTEAEVFASGGVQDMDRESLLEGNWLVVPRPSGSYASREAYLGELLTTAGPVRTAFATWSWSFEVTERL